MEDLETILTYLTNPPSRPDFEEKLPAILYTLAFEVRELKRELALRPAFTGKMGIHIKRLLESSLPSEKEVRKLVRKMPRNAIVEGHSRIKKAS